MSAYSSSTATRIDGSNAASAGQLVASACRKSPTVVRLVLDLKDEVVAQAFALKPVAEFGHRLVVDLIPAAPPTSLPVRRSTSSGASIFAFIAN